MDHVALVREANKLCYRLAKALLTPDDLDHMVRLQTVLARAVERMMRRSNTMLAPQNNPMLGE